MLSGPCKRFLLVAATLLLLIPALPAAAGSSAAPPNEHVTTGLGRLPVARARDEFPLPAAVVADVRARTRVGTTSTANAVAGTPFMTRPYIGWHSLNSYFDHCSPDYGVDNQLCTVDGLVARKSNGYDPSFPKGYAASPGGSDYVYYDGHNGFDLGLSYEPLLAVAPGTVQVAGTDPVNPCFGLNVTIDHHNGYTTRYAHMSRVDVVSGENVARGQGIGVSGTTGCSTGPHLHFGLYTTNPWNAIDPWGWLGTPGADQYPYDTGDMWLTGNPQDPFPQAPVNAAAVLSGTTATVTWTPGFDGGEPFSSFTVRAMPGGATVTVAGDAGRAVFHDLQLGTAYSFTVTGQNAEGVSPVSAPSNSVTPVVPPTVHYFAEGFTGPGYTERLRLFMPALGGEATIDWYTPTGHTQTGVTLVAGVDKVVRVLDYVPANQDVAARVTLPGPGVVEREIDYSTPAWHGSERQVGVPAPQTVWNFAEGSTMNQFDEYLTLLNTQATDVLVNLNYMTERGPLPAQSVTVGAGRRVTVAVFGGAPGAGRGFGGVSIQVQARQPIVAERSLYLNGFDFGGGPVSDGHDAFGVAGAAPAWFFAEGSTLPGIYEYLTIENPNSVDAGVSIRYTDNLGKVTNRQVTVARQSRVTVFVFDAGQGVGRGVAGVSAQLTSTVPIVAERPMYVTALLGGGLVVGADVAPGVQAGASYFSFAGGSSLPGDSDFLTIANAGLQPATVTISYYGATGVATRTITVRPSTRYTVLVGDPTDGVGPGQTLEGMVVTSTGPIVLEKITYSYNADRYGASATSGGSSH